MRRIEEMVVVITGASAGIGRALAVALHGRGAKLALAARRLDRLEGLNRELGGGHLAVACDVAKEEDCRRLIEQATAHFGRIDTLVCNAGYGMARPVTETSHEEVRAMYETNLFGTLDCIRAAVPLMEKQQRRDGWRGQVMIVSSGAARRGLPWFGVYSSTKAAQLSIAEALRVELRPRGIAVTSVHPVGTETEFFDVAAEKAHATIPNRSGAKRMSAEKVARSMVKAIARPRPELWPFGPVRWALALNALFPRLGDRVMSDHRREMEEGNRQ
ncbi:MAG TPA: SDR family NAD(P)-dependent oxidoreductase [Tepidisphaeraceae bacterium]|jgi:NADP-dependent 3-hydroxy acid dehydrogenase YdfG